MRFGNDLFYVTHPRRSFLLLRISFPGRPIFIQFVPVGVHEAQVVAEPHAVPLDKAHGGHVVLQAGHPVIS